MRRPFSNILIVLFSLFLVIPQGLTTAQNSSGTSGARQTSRLSKHSRELLALARVNNKKTVSLLIGAQPGADQVVANSINSLGGTIRYREDDVSYLRADIPIDKVEAVAGLPGVQTADLNESFKVDPAPIPHGFKPAANLSVPPPGPGTPANNPYLSTRDIGAPQFVAAHPTFDGRGVKIGLLDGGVDLFTPELQTAKLLDGTPTRKILDSRTMSDPLAGEDRTWVNMQTKVNVLGGNFSAGGATYSGVAADGEYRFGVLSEASLGPESEYAVGCGADLNRNGLCGETFTVIWRLTDNRVWVDTNADRSFTGEIGMTDYALNYDVGTFGSDNPATPLRETVPFTVQTDNKDKFVNIGIIGTGHGTFVAGIAAGKNYFGGAINGSAPEAQIVSATVFDSLGFTSDQVIIEGSIFLAKTAKVDVISESLGGFSALNDGNDTLDLVTNRVIEKYKVPFFISSGNDGPGANTVASPATASKAIAVGGYVSKESELVNEGVDTLRDEYVDGFSSRGPREDGGLKPNILAPTPLLSTFPQWEDVSIFFVAPYPLPPGYIDGGGTSAAAPCAAGGAALLSSAAKQSHLQWDPEQLNQALRSSARYLSDFQAYEQGNGLMQVGQSWELLKRNIATVEINSQAPVNTVLSPFLPTPNRGPGIYEREGWQAGQAAQRTIYFTRSSGSPKPITYQLIWKGDDGTFSSQGSLTLPRDVAVPLAVQVAATTGGIHSAILNLDDPNTDGIDYQVMNTIVAAEQFNTANGFTIQQAVSVQRGDFRSFFINVPANAQALKVNITGVNGVLLPVRLSPTGTPIFSDYNVVLDNSPWTTQRNNPIPGVWEVNVFASAFSSVDFATFTFTASILSNVDISPASWTVDPATLGTPYSQSFTFTNLSGSFNGRAQGSDLGAAFSAHPTIFQSAPQLYSVEVPAGSSSILSRINNASDSAADIDLYLYNCTGPTCVLAAASTSPTANELVSVPNPTPGKWIVYVDPFSVPTGSTQYDYVDLYANAAFGSVSVADATAVHPYGASWTRTATATAVSQPPAGRSLKGFVLVVGDGVVLKRVDVDLLNVH
jgi:hypothetical protein